MVSTSEFRNGMVLRIEGELYNMVEYEHFKPGKGAAVVRTRLKSVKTGSVLDRTFRSGDKVDDVRLERRKMQFLYTSDDLYVFMDNKTYEQFELAKETVGDAVKYLKENEVLDVLIAENNALGVELPIFVELAVTKADPGVRGDTVSGATKPVVLETGASIQVPLFVETGDILKIDTRSDQYVERV
ncbi:MAG: elongation factor P [Candidatus Latescibacteria bacterium]|nr:elongation factor P [Candidatus Latescibacterota bacterium]